MKLFLVKRTDEVGYDQFDSMVVAAENAARAVLTHPYQTQYPTRYKRWWENQDEFGPLDSWALPHTLTVEEIGTTNRSAGVILASFNAG